MARIYAFCEGDAPIPAELVTYRAIEKFGVKAVMGRDVLTPAEITAMKIADLIQRLFSQRKASGEWAKWEQEHPEEAAVLHTAARLCQSE